MTDAGKIAEHCAFEAVFLGATKDKNGFVVKLAIHPQEVPEHLLRAWVGQRYQLAVVPLNDQNEAEAPKDMIDGERAIASAGMLCRLEKFWDFLNVTYSMITDISSEAECVDALHEILGVKSRSELMKNRQARERFDRLRATFRKIE